MLRAHASITEFLLLVSLVLLSASACSNAPGTEEFTPRTPQQSGISLPPEWTSSPPSLGTSSPTEEVQVTYRPIGDAECSHLAAAFSERLNTNMRIAEGVLMDFDGNIGSSCEISISGIRQTHLIDVELWGFMESLGWVEDFSLFAEGPDGNVNGFRGNDRLCMLHIKHWRGGEMVGPIAELTDSPLTSDEGLYDVTLECAEVVTSETSEASQP